MTIKTRSTAPKRNARRIGSAKRGGTAALKRSRSSPAPTSLRQRLGVELLQTVPGWSEGKRARVPLYEVVLKSIPHLRRVVRLIYVADIVNDAPNDKSIPACDHQWIVEIRNAALTFHTDKISHH